MKCPFQTTVTHVPEHFKEGIVKVFAKDVTTFGECLEEDCPFFGARWIKMPGETSLAKRPECRRHM